jgi:hypothetical protein
MATKKPSHMQIKGQSMITNPYFHLSRLSQFETIKYQVFNKTSVLVDIVPMKMIAMAERRSFSGRVR